MPEYPDAIRRLAAGAVFSLNIHGPVLKGLDTRQEAEVIAAAVLDSVAEQIGEACAREILAHMEAAEPVLRVAPRGAALTRRNVRRLHYQAAARVAARAFLAEEDVKRMAAEAFARGDYVACPAPEDDDA